MDGYGWMAKCLGGGMDERTDGWMVEWMDG